MIKSDLFSLPNLLTWSRIAAIPLILVFVYFDTKTTDWIAAWIFGISSLTDWMDGFLARRFQLSTRLGKLLDPLADKLIILTCMIMLLELGRLDVVIFGWQLQFIGPLLVIVTVGRAIAITGLRAIASAEGLVIPASAGGKLKTFLQSIAVLFLLLGPRVELLGLSCQTIGLFVLIISVVLSLTSALDYLRGFYEQLPDGDESESKSSAS